jgi:ketosteroid isomerase-like protein
MKRLIARLLMTGLCVGMVLAQAQTTTPAPKTSPSTDTAADELKQIENDWVNAVKTKNADKLKEILANDWVEMRWDGVTVKKTQALEDLKEPGNSLESFEMGPMLVRIFGNTAIVTGSDTEKSTDNGKDTSGRYVWTDVFVKQSGQWKAVASQSSKVPK